MLKEFYRLLAAWMIGVCSLLAQSTGTIQGTVTDPSGAAVPTASVTVRNLATGEERSFTTDQSGLYVVPSLPVGRYSVTAKATGLETTTVNDVVLEVSRIVQEDFRLAIAAGAESVEIAATAPVINTATTAVGTTVDQRTVQEIPLNGRHFVDLGLLTAGTIAPPASSYLGAPLRGQGSFAIISAGNREDATNFMINGINSERYGAEPDYLPAFDQHRAGI